MSVRDRSLFKGGGGGLVQIGGGSSIFMQGKKGGPYKFMQVFNGSGRRATQFRM